MVSSWEKTEIKKLGFMSRQEIKMPKWKKLPSIRVLKLRKIIGKTK